MAAIVAVRPPESGKGLRHDRLRIRYRLRGRVNRLRRGRRRSLRRHSHRPLGGGPNGGYLLGICLRALGAELPDTHPDPLVVSAYYLRAGTVGAADLKTEVVRTGRRMATGEVRLLQDGKETVRVVANFTDLDAAEGRTEVLGNAPTLPVPEECVDVTGGQSFPGLTIADRYDYRFAEVPGWPVGSRPGSRTWSSGCASRPAGRHAEPRADGGRRGAGVMELGGYISSTIELTVHVRARPAPGWLACRVDPVPDRRLHEEDFEIGDTTGVLVAQGRQLALLPPPHTA